MLVTRIPTPVRCRTHVAIDIQNFGLIESVLTPPTLVSQAQS
jgi:hypothetical protein